MKILYALFIVVVLMTSCISKKKKDIPADLIKPDMMVKILEEVHTADALLGDRTILTFEEWNKIKKKDIMYNSIFKKYNVTREVFDNSLVFYTANPVYITEMYDTIVVHLERASKASPTKVGEKE